MTPALLSILYVLLAVVGLVAIGVLLARAGKSRQRRADEVRSNAEETLVVEVPHGQDPAAIVAALQADGIDAMTDPSDPLKVLVPTPAGADRERARVRAVVDHATLNFEDDPGPGGRARFTDEEPGDQPGDQPGDHGGGGSRPAH